MIHTLAELLTATGADDVDDLASLVDDETELDGSLDVEAAGVAVFVDLFWCEMLTYPFTLEQFWLAVGQLDDESLQAYEDFEDHDPDHELPDGPVRSAVHQFVLDRDATNATADERNP